MLNCNKIAFFYLTYLILKFLTLLKTRTHFFKTDPKIQSLNAHNLK